jgi:polyisoprenoid-binding protein YceI
MTRALVLAGVVWFTPPALAQQQPVPDGVAREGTLSFDAKASAGDFTGLTSTIGGELKGAKELALVRGWVEAPVSSLNTGNGRRDRDLNKVMESAAYPALRFELDTVEVGTGSSDSLSATLKGRLTLHGVTQEVSLPATLTRWSDGVRVLTTFPLNVKDYNVKGLSKFLGILKMDEHIVVHVDVIFGYNH